MQTGPMFVLWLIGKNDLSSEARFSRRGCNGGAQRFPLPSKQVLPCASETSGACACTHTACVSPTDTLRRSLRGHSSYPSLKTGPLFFHFGSGPKILKTQCSKISFSDAKRVAFFGPLDTCSKRLRAPKLSSMFLSISVILLLRIRICYECFKYMTYIIKGVQ